MGKTWCCLPSLLLLLLLGTTARAEEPGYEIPTKAWSALDQTARALAAAGRGDDLESMFDIVRELGRDTDSLGKLRERCEKALKRGKRTDRNDQKAAKALAKAVKALSPVLATTSDPERTKLAELLLRLDDRHDAAHEAAGHVKAESGWTVPWMVPLLEKRREIAQALRDARKLEIPIETGPSSHPLLQAIYGKPGVKATWKNVSIHSVKLDAERLERILRQTLRAFALSSWLRGGPLAVPTVASAFTAVKLPSKPDYKRAVDYAVKTGGMPAGEAAEYRELAWFRHTKARYIVVGYRTEATIEASMLDDLLDGTAFGQAQTCLYVGHVTWLCLSIFGTWHPGWAFTTSTSESATAGRTGSPEDRQEREEAELVADAGLAGSRSYLRYLVGRREDPPWTDAMQDRRGKIEGDSLLKTTIVTEFLQEGGDLQRLVSVRGATPDEVAAGIESVLKLPMAEFERRWRGWLLPARASLARRLEPAADEGAKVGAPVRKLLTYLHGVRVQALESPQADVLPPLTLDAELSEGCVAHARYLDGNPGQKASWPEAHEEFPDKAGFSPAGSLAGLNSVIAFGGNTPSEFVDEWLATFYHRLPLLHPGLRRVGWGFDKSVAVLDCASMVTVRTHQLQARWPYEGQTGVPRSFQPELPNPVPGADQSVWGYPVTLQNYTVGWDTSRLRMQLFHGSAKAENEVDCYFSSPGAPTNPELSPAETWCLIPKRVLDAKQRYVVVVTGLIEKPGWSWTFTTGR